MLRIHDERRRKDSENKAEIRMARRKECTDKFRSTEAENGYAVVACCTVDDYEMLVCRAMASFLHHLSWLLVGSHGTATCMQVACHIVASEGNIFVSFSGVKQFPTGTAGGLHSCKNLHRVDKAHSRLCLCGEISTHSFVAQLICVWRPRHTFDFDSKPFVLLFLSQFRK